LRVFLVFSLLLSILFINIGYGMIMSYISIFLKQNSVDSIMIGIVNASFFVGATLSSLFSSKLISQVGHIRSFTAFSSLLIGAFLLHALVFNEYLWIIFRTISGFSYYSLLVILESWLSEKSDDKSRGAILSMYTITFYFANAVGQFTLSSFMDILQEDIFVLGSILMVLPIISIAFTKIKEPQLHEVKKISLPKIYSVVPLSTTASFIAGFFIGGYFTMMPVFVLDKFSTTEYISTVISITILGGLLSQYPIGKLSDKIGRRKVISMVGFLTAISSSLFLFFEFDMKLLYLFGFLLGLTVFSIYPLAVARANDVIHEDSDIVEISRVLLLFIGLGSFVSPFVIGFSLQLSNDSMFIIFAIVGIYLGFYSLSKSRVKDDELSYYINIPTTATQEIQILDPRVAEEEYEDFEVNDKNRAKK